MSKYLIHTCNKRLWYVQEYLIPSMLKQGIDPNDVSIYLDENNEGCLESCMKAFMSVKGDGGTWHLQDDVLICSDFKERTESYTSGIVCGYCYEKDDRKRFVGEVPKRYMWYSFPCIRIPNYIARGCAKWYFNYAKTANEYRVWIKLKKYDDSMFDIYLQDYCKEPNVLNLTPNLVEHVDYLIGGSIANDIRPEKQVLALCFEDRYLVTELEEKLANKNEK